MRRSALILRSSLISILGLAVLAGAASAGQPRTHDGFLLRLSAGGGGAKTSEDFENSSLEISGSAGDVNFAIGGMISPNFAIHGTLFGWSLTDPEVELTGYGSGELNGDLSMSAVGAGFTYYFMPANLYISPSVGVGTMTLDIDGLDDIESDPGLALDFTLGKEWWVGNSWGLGVAGAVGYHSIPDKGTDDKITGSNVTIRFTATYN
jgi:hypothetical protein